MQKKTIVILLCALILLPVFALPIHLQTGFSWNYDFWKLTSENTYVANRKNTFRFLQSDSETHFDVTLNGKSIHLQMTETGENQYRFDGDGWAMEITDTPFASVRINGTFYSMGDETLIVTNAQSPVYHFAPCHFETSYFENEEGKRLGEHIDLVTDTSYYISSYEIWYEQPEMSSFLPEPILFNEGLRITNDRALYVNEQGEYLTNAQYLFMLETSPDSYCSKADLLRFLLKATKASPPLRGDLICFVFYFVFCLIGLCMLIWPEQLAFFGSRWIYRHEPELSDMGLLSMYISAGVIILVGIVLLYLPLFIQL